MILPGSEINSARLLSHPIPLYFIARHESYLCPGTTTSGGGHWHNGLVADSRTKGIDRENSGSTGKDPWAVDGWNCQHVNCVNPQQAGVIFISRTQERERNMAYGGEKRAECKMVNRGCT